MERVLDLPTPLQAKVSESRSDIVSFVGRWCMTHPKESIALRDRVSYRKYVSAVKKDTRAKLRGKDVARKCHQH